MAGRVLASMTGAALPAILDTPKRAMILVQLDCNARCPFCSTRVYTDQGLLSPLDYREHVARRAKDYTLSLEELKQLYDRLRADGVERVNLQGGEPTLHPGLVELVRYGRALGFSEQSIVTNGRALKDRALARALVEAGPRTLVLSIFGHTPELHDASLGVAGAFADLTEAVQVLVELKREGAPVSLMGQLTLHAQNFEALPEMVRHWHDRGLQDFAVRLLRETENTRLDGSGKWFFDLERLRAPLDRLLSFCRSVPDLMVNLSELPYCLIAPHRLGFVLADLGSNPGLLQGRPQHARFFLTAQGEGRAGGTGGFEACARCDLNELCVRPEEAILRRFTGSWRPWGIAREAAALAKGEWSAGSLDAARHLLQEERRLVDFGVADDVRLELRARLAREVSAPEERAHTLLGDRGAKEMADRLRKNGARPVQVRLLAASALGLQGPFDGPAERWMGELETASLPQGGTTLAFLRRATVLANEPLTLVFAYQRRAPGGSGLALVIVYDDRFVDQAQLEGAVAATVTQRA